jgi:hypothetical protein
VSGEIASRVEIAGRKVIIYLDSLVKGTPVGFRFQVKALYPVRAEPPVSRVYEYYDPDVQAATRGPGLEVREPSETTFIRGDMNADGALDISDPVGVLQYMFLGDSAPDCLDRADSNDDGAVNITDPIIILELLFLGGAALPEPFPEPGTDPTPDALICP